jgi:hypothetical protein
MPKKAAVDSTPKSKKAVRKIPNSKKDTSKTVKPRKATIEKKALAEKICKAPIPVYDAPAENQLRTAHFDIGTKNFAFYVEDADKATLTDLKERYHSLPKKNRRRIKGPMNDDIEAILDDLYTNSTTVEARVNNVRVDAEDASFTIDTRKSLFQYLTKYKQLWSTIDTFVIEQQFFNTFTMRGKKKGGTEANVTAIKVAECLVSWLLIHYPTANISFFGSQFKTQTLGCPDKTPKPQRKKWSTAKGREILERRKETDIISKFDTLASVGQKLDDVCDCIIQCQAWKFREMVGEF